MSKMADELRKDYVTGPCKQYSSYYKWTLHDWPLLFDSYPQREATSFNFDLNGTPGYACKFSLSPPQYPDSWNFIVELSDTLGIAILILKVRFYSGKFEINQQYNNPIDKRLKYALGSRFDKHDRNYMFISVPSELVMEIDVTILRESDVISCLNPTAVPPIMFNTSNSAPPNISAELKTMFEQKTLCDVTFVLGDETFCAHKVVLAAQSKAFAAMFSSDMKERKDNIIHITNTTAEVFQQFLNYLYSGEIKELENVVEEMIVIADFYDISHLKSMCEYVMSQSLSEKSAIRYAILADKVNCDTLKKGALGIIRNRATVLEQAILEEEFATILCLKEILSNNQPEKQAEPIVS